MTTTEGHRCVPPTGAYDLLEGGTWTCCCRRVYVVADRDGALVLEPLRDTDRRSGVVWS